MEKAHTQTRQFDSLADIRQYKDEVMDSIRADEQRIGDLWHDLFHTEDDNLPATPARRLTRMVSVGTGVVDGIFLGWKLYRKFKGTASFFAGRRKRR